MTLHLNRLVILGSCMLLAMAGYHFDSQQRNHEPRVSLVSSLTESQRNDVLSVLLNTDVDLKDLNEVKDGIESIDWVYRAFIARKWPGDLSIEIRVQEAIAYWNDDGFINSDGEVFVTDHIVGGDLPQLYGPDASAPRVMNEYQQLNRVLFRTGRAIEVLTLNERGAWEFRDHSGILVSLGKEDIQPRLERSIRVLEALAAKDTEPEPARVDARYNNGVSVEWVPESGDLKVARNFKLQRDVSL